jgi:hypothetical protein
MNKILLIPVRYFSRLTSPSFLPLLAFIIIFSLSHLRLLMWQHKAMVLGMIYICSVCIPFILIFIYRRIRGLSKDEVYQRKHRFVPFLATLASYTLLLSFMKSIHMPYFTIQIIHTCILLMAISILCNFMFNISTHVAGASAIVGLLMVLGITLHFNPIFWMCIAILHTGLIASIQSYMRLHSMSELLNSAIIGWFCGFSIII